MFLASDGGWLSNIGGASLKPESFIELCEKAVQ